MTEDELRRTAVERAYREHADGVYRIAYAILRDPDEASDAVHDARDGSVWIVAGRLGGAYLRLDPLTMP